jgi:hypothetical protein
MGMWLDPREVPRRTRQDSWRHPDSPQPADLIGRGGVLNDQPFRMVRIYVDTLTPEGDRNWHILYYSQTDRQLVVV